MKYFACGLAFFMLSCVCAQAWVIKNEDGIVQVDRWGAKKKKDHEKSEDLDYNFRKPGKHEIQPTWMH